MIQVYTGNGKGKTTAAIGLAMRALGAGKSVYIMQFMKSLAYSEQNLLRQISAHYRLILKTTGKPFFIIEEGASSEEIHRVFGDNVVVFPKGHPPADYCQMLADSFKQMVQDVSDGSYDVVILDELNMALAFGLLKREHVEDFLPQWHGEEKELIITGRNAPKWLADEADLVTEMQEVKHYFQKGLMARKGIED